MAHFSYLKPDTLYDCFKDSEKSMLPLFDPLQEYERIARNRPHPKIDKAYPKVTDGTLAAIIQEAPKRYLQQLPVGHVKTNLGDWFDIYANWKLTEDIIPKADCQADALQKAWRAGSNSMTYGSCHAFVFMDYYEGELCANFKLPYITHVYLPKGKVSTKDSKYLFMEAWYQENDIDYIIDREKRLKKKDKNYQGEWDIKALEKIKKNRETKNEDQQSPNERDRDINEEDGIRIIHAFQRGVGAKFFSFTLDNKSNGVEVVRTKVNPDPRGEMPVHTLYFNIDFSNPLGRGAVELSGGMQNLIDAHTQAFQYMQALEMNPPMVVSNDMPQGAVKFVPNKIIRKASQQSTIEPLRISTSAITNFPTTYGLIKSQILNLNNSSDTSVSAESGNPGFSKTQAGVNALQQRLGVSDNYLRKQMEGWLSEIYETMLNLTFAETTGKLEQHLDPKTADKLRELIPEGNRVITWVDIENSDTVVVDFDLLGDEPIYFEVDAGTSQVNEDNSQLEALTAARELVMEMLPVSKRMAFVNKLVGKLGIEDPEDVSFTKEEIKEAEEAERVQQEQAKLEAQAQDEEQKAPELTPEEIELVEGLQQRNFPPEAIEQAVVMLREDYEPEEVLQILMQGMGV